MDENLKQILNWNEKNPVGTPVRVRTPDRTTFETFTTSEARMLGSDVVVVWVDHNYSCRLLEDVEAV